MRRIRWTVRSIVTAGFVVGCFANGAVGQLEIAASDDDRASLLDMIEPRPEGPTVNTALAFTNPWGREVKVSLRAFDHTGEPVGSGEFVLPPRALKYFFVSRLLSDANPRFVGWVQANTSLPISPSAVLVGAGVTDLPVEKTTPPDASLANAIRRYRILFPLTAAF